MRISIGTLFGAAAFMALAVAVVMFPSAQWLGILQNTLGALLLLMLVAGVAVRGKPRAFAFGFATASLAYIAIAFAPMISVRDKLITHRALEFANKQFSPDASARFAADRHQTSEIGVKTTPVRLGSPAFESGSDIAGVDELAFFDSGHLLWSLLIGITGGTLAAGMTAKPSQ